MDRAIEAIDLKKPYPPAVTALDGVSLAVPAGHDLRAARPQRRRQIDDRAGPVHAHAPRSRQRARRRDRRARRSGRRAPRDRRRRAEARGRPGGDRTREPHCSRASSTGSPAATLRQRVSESLERFGLTDAADRQARRTRAGCSGGWTSRWACCIARSVLFLDEPTTGLDPEARTEMWHEIERLAATRSR